MARQPDPYRTLGLDRGATLAEVKQAYRRLAKANHPDRAGEGALPRFLAIQAAYDQIAGPDGGGRRSGPGAATSSAAPRRPWDADPDRAGATHRAYAGRARRARPNAGPRPRTGTSGAGGGGAGTGTGRAAGGSASGSARPERPPNKATLGSTSYDGVGADPFEPDWAGASWYGTTSGTYWTLNPKEYADPRKHGPEYQARARRNRVAGRAGSVGSLDVDPLHPPTDQPPEQEPRPDREPDPGPGPDPGTGPPPTTHTTASWWDSTTADPTAPPPGPARGTTDGRHRTWTAGDTRAQPSPGPDRAARTTAEPRSDGGSDDSIVASVRGWLDDARPGPAARVGRAVAGWAPIALGISWGAGEVSGCGRFSADCDPAVGPASWLVEIGLLLLLLLVPRLARIATTATLATLAAVIPGSVLLLATSDPGAVAAGRSALGGLMIIAWVAGLAVGIGRSLRSVRRPRPVS